MSDLSCENPLSGCAPNNTADSEEAVVGQVADEFTDRLQRGEQPAVEEYAERYPQIAELLHPILPALQIIAPVPGNAESAPGTADFGTITEQPGTVLGPYKLMEQIGEGGMGLVFVAEQQHPVRRKVALKIIKPGMDSQQVIARFEAERQALALMDHQNIAKVFDAGTTESGRPYFVMELVHGIPITDYCDANRLRLRERLELFIPVCHAIQHAHQKGIIHRDLKPSNILVTMYDDKPVPKVIDFGVAKAIEQRLTEKTVYTQFGTLVGTLEYMSPEQAEMNAFGVDTRSDVYALGVLLYELLTGTTPLQRHRLREAAYADIVRLIKEEEPPLPSTRLSRSGAALTDISQRRGSAPGQLTELVRGELDWIVMRCLEKDRTRRYETANGLARDVEHYLHDEPVEACPPTAGYKLRKFARKNKRLLATTAGFVILLLSGVAGSGWQAVRATQAEAVANANAVQARDKEQEANRQRDEAQQQRDEVQVLNRQLRATQTHLRRTLYAAHMNLAQHALEVGDIGRVAELLESHRPKAEESDLRGFEWYYLYRLCHAELLTLQGHSGGVPADRSVAFSPDGKSLASAARDNTIKLWDAHTGQELRVFKGHTASIRGVAFSPDGKRLASGSSDKTVKIWDTRTGQERLTLKGHTDRVWSVAFSPDGKRLASASDDKTVKVWDAHTGQELLTFKGHMREVKSGGSGGVNGVAFSPDGKRVASVAHDGTVIVWDAQSGQELLTFTGAFLNPAFSPDGKRLAICGGHGKVKIWDAQTGQELLTLQASTSQVNGVAFSPDGKRLASASGAPFRAGMVKVWDAQTGQELLTFKGHPSGVIDSVVFSPDGFRLASSSNDGIVKIWDATSNPEARMFSGQTGAVFTGVAFSPDGKRLAAASGIWDATKKTHVAWDVKVWEARTGQELLTLKGHTGPIYSVAFSPDGKRLACGSGTWDAANRTFVAGKVKVWDAESGQELRTLTGHTAAVVSVTFSPDSTRLASCSSLPGQVGSSEGPGEPGVGCSDRSGTARPQGAPPVCG